MIVYNKIWNFASFLNFEKTNWYKSLSEIGKTYMTIMQYHLLLIIISANSCMLSKFYFCF